MSTEWLCSLCGHPFHLECPVEGCVCCKAALGNYASFPSVLPDPTPDQVTRACEAYAAETGATWVSPRGMAAALKAGR